MLRSARSKAPPFTGMIRLVRGGLQRELKRHVKLLKTEQFVYELAELDKDTGMVSEARMDLIAEMPELCAMLDVRVFLSTAKVWKSTRSNEMETHRRYVTHVDGRRCTIMKLYTAVVSTYHTIET